MAPPNKDNASAALIPLFKSLGLPDGKALEASKSKSAPVLKDLVETYSLTGLDEKTAGLVAAYATSLAKTSSPVGEAERKYVLDKILDGSLKSGDQVGGAIQVILDWECFIDLRPCSCYELC